VPRLLGAPLTAPGRSELDSTMEGKRRTAKAAIPRTLGTLDQPVKSLATGHEKITGCKITNYIDASWALRLLGKWSE
jgi:hypothetical protein